MLFSVTLRNDGDGNGSIDFTPVRLYDDGTLHDSPDDQLSVDVAAGETARVHRMYTYQGGGLDACAIDVDGVDVADLAVIH